MSFWNLGTSNPKRKFRFKVYIGGANWDGGTLWYAKSCTAPSVEVSAVEHMFSDHVFNFPGRAKWGDVEMVLVDPAGGGATALEGGASASPNTVANFANVLTAFGYDVPSDGDGLETISRNKIQDLSVTIMATDDDGTTIESWELHNAFPIAFKFGDWDYGTDDLREMSVTWKYDWATVETKSPDGGEDGVAKSYFSG